MTKRLNWLGRPNPAVDGLRGVKAVLGKTLDQRLLALVEMRASQINGCAYCLHMHSQHARALGETDDRLLLLDAWHESALYSDRERAALAWTEALTRIADSRAPDDVYEQVHRHFADDELMALSIAISMINLWNRLAVGFRLEHPADRREAG